MTVTSDITKINQKSDIRLSLSFISNETVYVPQGDFKIVLYTTGGKKLSFSRTDGECDGVEVTDSAVILRANKPRLSPGTLKMELYLSEDDLLFCDGEYNPCIPIDLPIVITKEAGDDVDVALANAIVYFPSDEYFYPKEEVDTMLEGKSDTDHTHTVSDVTDLSGILDQYAGINGNIGQDFFALCYTIANTDDVSDGQAVMIRTSIDHGTESVTLTFRDVYNGDYESGPALSYSFPASDTTQYHIATTEWVTSQLSDVATISQLAEKSDLPYVVGTSANVITLDENIIYDCGTIHSAITVKLPSDVNAAYEYEFRFVAGVGASVVLPDGVVVAGNASLAVEVGKTYRCIIVNNVLYFSATSMS